MDKLTLNFRLRVYSNYGVVGFLIMFFLLQEINEELMLFFPLLFNLGLTLVFKSKAKNKNIQIVLIGIAIWILTTMIFWLQYQYRDYINAYCIPLIWDWTANTSYASTLIMLSIVGWEIGCWWMKRIQTPFNII